MCWVQHWLRGVQLELLNGRRSRSCGARSRTGPGHPAPCIPQGTALPAHTLDDVIISVQTYGQLPEAVGLPCPLKLPLCSGELLGLPQGHGPRGHVAGLHLHVFVQSERVGTQQGGSTDLLLP